MSHTTTLWTGLAALGLLLIVLPSAAAEIPDGDTRCEADFNLFTGSGHCTGGPHAIWYYDTCPEDLEAGGGHVHVDCHFIDRNLTECTYDRPLAIRCRFP